MTVGSETTLYNAPPTDVSQNQGAFRTHFNFPGRLVPGHDDHGYGPLATVVESLLDPDTLIAMHPHRNDEIVSWVPAGVMRHDDREGNELVTDREHLLVMNAGRGFWHEERTLADDPPLRMLQIFVRPHSLDLEPRIQHGPIADPVDDEWRHVFGPDGSDAPFTVRNAVDCFDARLEADSSVDLPDIDGRDTYFYVFEGALEAEGTRFDERESGLAVGDGMVTVTAREATIAVAFCIDPDAPVTRQGTIGR
ncbi:pirin family protein [Salinadaptatus halalkaliphilus]|uniref:Pirin family protein n=1 Tax=Salinadaptatus halalkaliphilus TaxID=2419781 RepID=A0A4S3TM70_9EURY|nr:pirin family protein [Salinadaptatus halalkaliphilus]THE65282.1 pirin family protein [Salinadaptatus halalkaliphilus]